MLASDQSAVTDKENLYHRFILISCKCDHILVIHLRTGNLLLLINLLYTVQQISVRCRFFKIHFFRSRIHLLRQHLNHRLEIAAKEMQHLPHIFTVSFLRDVSLAWCLALSHMIIQTRPVIAGLLRQTPAAVPNLVDFL